MELRPHQARAYTQVMATLDERGLAMLAGETRSGKTAVAISCCKAMGGPWLFVTKKKAIPSIDADARSIWGREDHGGVIVNVESLGRVKRQKWALVVADESHHGLSGFPKEPKARRQMREAVGDAPVLVMSGTPAIEGTAKLYGQMTLGKRGPWVEWPTFYQWWHQDGHYVKKRSGGYGVAGAIKNTGSQGSAWGPTPDYGAVDEARILREVEPYVVRMTRSEAGYRVQNAQIIPVVLDNARISALILKLRSSKCIHDLDLVCDKGPAQVLQQAHILAGGHYSVDGEFKVLPSEFDPEYRARWIGEGMREGRSYVVLTHYVAERPFVASILERMAHMVHDSLDDLRESGEGVFVGALSSLAEGVDMSWLTGSQILYSLTWSGSKFSQVCDRQLNFHRSDPAKVAVPLLRGGVDADVLEAVMGKQNFNAGFYRGK